MSTRSTIAKRENGVYTVIYCHFDGDIDWNGRILKENYSDLEKINKLLALGDLSALGTAPEPTECVRKYGFEYWKNPEWEKLPEDEKDRLNEERGTIAYGRDRGEKWESVKPSVVKLKEYEEIADFTYNYIYDVDEDVWYVRQYKYDGEEDKNNGYEIKTLNTAIENLDREEED